MIDYLPKQITCLAALGNDMPAEVVLFGGAAGGSKSFIGCAWQIQRRLKYAGTRGLIGRSKLDTLKKTTLRTFFEVAQMMGLRAEKHYSFNAQANIITFHNGSEIILKDLFSYPSDPNFDSLGSLEITDWFVDEVSQVSEKAVNIVRSRVRFKLREYNIRPKGLMTTNPCKGWLYNGVYQPWRDGCLDGQYSFIPALPGDNPHLPESYIDSLSRLPEQDRKRLLEGDWDYDDSKDRIFDYDDLTRMFTLPMTTGSMYISADIAAMGDDETIIGVWSGYSLTHIYRMRHKLPHEVASEIRKICSTHSVPLNNTIVDADGLGIGVYGILKCRQFLNGGAASDGERYLNMRSECYFKLAELVRLNRISCHVMSDRDDIIKQLDAIRRKDMNSEKRLAIIGRDQIMKSIGKSPDMASMMMMRMFFELKPNYGKYAMASF